MNYQHQFHAGNFADVFKHIVLCLCLEKFHEKQSPFFVLDTHAGSGKYLINDQKTREAENGIYKILRNSKFKEILPESFLKILSKTNICQVEELPHKTTIYNGSPSIIKNFLRSQDRAIFVEKQENAFLQLKRNFAGNQKILSIKQDGLSSLKSKLPPIEKRGLILIDPAYEKMESKISADYAGVLSGLMEAKRRFAHGVYLLWHPIVNGEEKFLEIFYRKIHELAFDKTSHFVFEIKIRPEESIYKHHENLGLNQEFCRKNNKIQTENAANQFLQKNEFLNGEDLMAWEAKKSSDFQPEVSRKSKMSRCGMFVFNTPWLIEEKLNKILPQISELLSV